jgi:alkanesulfonate monooxygenase SsuD/methylene tetrahydromethanopterin reductase-like flavin-dependent oxidoreductase (luciferase family)
MLADAWIPGPTADLARLVDGKQQILAYHTAAGLTAPVAEWPLTRDVIIADRDATARELAERHIMMVSYRDEYAGSWKHSFIDSHIAADLGSLMRDRFIIGGPEQCIAQIRRFIDAFEVTYLICRLFFPGMPHTHIMREPELLAREVMRAFQAGDRGGKHVV